MRDEGRHLPSPHGRSDLHSPILFPSAGLCPCEQGRLYGAAQVMCRTFSPECFSQGGAGPVLPSVTHREGQDQLCSALSWQPSVVSGAMDTNTDHGYIGVMNLGLGHGSNPGPDITMSLGGNEATHVSPSCTSFASSDVPLFTGHEPFCLCLQHCLLMATVPVCPCFLLGALGISL